MINVERMSGGAKILIIDDEPNICRFIEVGLSDKFAIYKTHTGQRGIDAARDIRPDAIILDLELPDMDGFQVLTRLRQWSAIPIIILTVRDAIDEKIQLLEHGADDYITKPFDLAELAVRIKVALRHTTGKQNDIVLTAGPLRIDLAARQAYLNADNIKLTATEYDLLKILASQAGKMVTQRHLLREVWGPESIHQVQYLRVYIAQIRKKLGLDYQNMLVTEPGVGYRLKLG